MEPSNKQNLTQERNPRRVGETLLLPFHKYCQHMALGGVWCANRNISCTPHCHCLWEITWEPHFAMIWASWHQQWCSKCQYLLASGEGGCVLVPSCRGHLLPKVISPAVSCARISAVTSHSPAPLCELIRELHLGSGCPAVNCDSHRGEPPLLSLPLLQIAATFTRWMGHAAKGNK